MALRIQTQEEAQVLVGRTIKGVEFNPLPKEDGTVTLWPLLCLDDGSNLAFDHSGESVTLRYVSVADLERGRAQVRAALKNVLCRKEVL